MGCGHEVTGPRACRHVGCGAVQPGQAATGQSNHVCIHCTLQKNQPQAKINYGILSLLKEKKNERSEPSGAEQAAHRTCPTRQTMYAW